MPKISDTELFKSIKSGSLENVYFLYGEEKYFIKKAFSQLKDKIVPSGMETFNLASFNGEKMDLNLFEEAVEGLPVMSDKKCVVVNDLDFEKFSKSDVDIFLKIIQDIPAQTILIIYNSFLVFDAKKSTKTKKLITAVEKVGAACDFAFKDIKTLKRALCEKAKNEFISLDMEVAQLIITRCGESYEVLSNELDKLISYAKDGEITSKDVLECTIATIDCSAFDLAKSILSNNFDKAYRLLDELFFLRQEPVAILSAISMAFADLYRAKCAQNAGVSAKEVTKDFSYPPNRSFAVEKAFREIRNFSTLRLRFCMKELLTADHLLKSSKLSDRLILEQMIGRMLKNSLEENAI